MSTTDLACCHEVKSFHRTILQPSDKVFFIIAVFFVYTLSVHDIHFIAESAIIGLSKERKTQVTTILNAHQRVAAATSQICDAFRIDVNGFHRSRRKGILVRETVLELSQSYV